MSTNIFSLDSKVAIYVPSTVNTNELDKNSLQKYFENLVLAEFSELFGGATATSARGAWMSPEAGLVTEDVTVIYSFCRDDDFKDNFDKVVALAGLICKGMQQEAVTLEYNNKVAFITPEMS